MKLKQDLDRVIRPGPQLYVDEVVMQSRIKKHETSDLDDLSTVNISPRRFNRRYSSIHVLPKKKQSHTSQLNRVNDDLIELIYGEQEKKETSKHNMWQEDESNDTFQSKAREILQYDQRDLRQYIAIESEDPILQAHSELPSKLRNFEEASEVTDFENNRIPTRYLTHRTYRWKFNFDRIFSRDTKAPKRVHSVVKNVSRARIFLSKTSKIISKDHILDSETPFRGAAQFSIKDANLANIDLIDANLSRFKEVEELYTEIMKSVDESKIEREDGTFLLILDIEYVYICPAAPQDQSLNDCYDTDPILALRNRRPTSLTPNLTKDTLPRNRSISEVLKKPLRARVNIDLFRRNRKRAMRKTKSSKYNFKYNYGGYIPAKVLSKEAQMHHISTEDYDDHLANVFCDFIPMLIYKEKREGEKLQQIEQVRLKDEELLRAQQEREEEGRIKEEEIKMLFEPEPEKWKVSVLDYIASEESAGREMDIAYAPPKLPTFQELLENLWLKLEMPADQKFDMAIKYGSHKFKKIGDAINLWLEVSELILEREKMLIDIELFEQKSSDPARFFEKVTTEERGTRFEEAIKREKLLRPLHSLEAKIENSCSTIRNQLSETVTYRGIPYVEKMKVDYANIIRGCTKRKGENDQTNSLKSKN
jgi:hypothetical protein